MNLAVSSRLIPGLTDEMTKGPNIHFLKTNDSKNKEGVSHVKESLDKGGRVSSRRCQGREFNFKTVGHH